MIIEKKRIAGLLINQYEDIENFKKTILNSYVYPMDQQSPTCRFRGTLVDMREGHGSIKITGWQRNFARIQKMDVSLPMIVTMTIDKDGIIKDIRLDSSFKGSKGLLCSGKYLDQNLQRELKGQAVDSAFIKKVKVERMHCFHLTEILSGVHSYLQILKQDDFQAAYPGMVSFEEEALDSFVENGSFYTYGQHVLKGKPPVRFYLAFHDLLSSIGFDKEGHLIFFKGVKTDFSVDDRLILSDIITLNTPGSGHMDLIKYLFDCVRELQTRLCRGKGIKIYNTNLHPQAFIGLLIQSNAIRFFESNYNYAMHALTALQRSADRPLCVGALNGEDEAASFFPYYNFADII